MQAGAEAHDATAGRHEPRKQTKKKKKKNHLDPKVLRTPSG